MSPQNTKKYLATIDLFDKNSDFELFRRLTDITERDTLYAIAEGLNYYWDWHEGVWRKRSSTNKPTVRVEPSVELAKSPHAQIVTLRAMGPKELVDGIRRDMASIADLMGFSVLSNEYSKPLPGTTVYTCSFRLQRKDGNE